MSSAAPISHAPQRLDIQALRGIAVTLVVLYHADHHLVRAGFLGVDVFFVVSGFLITGLIARALGRGSFSFADFYARRVRRLLPAGYAVLALTTLGAFALLSAVQYRDFIAQLLGSLAFSNNMVLWRQTGYFAPDAAFRPLLHMWSLAIEEQYYLLMPLALWLLPRRWTLAAVAAVTLASLALCFYVMRTSPSVAFFFLPTRAWELGIGSVAALIAGRAEVRPAARALLYLALTLIFAIPLFPLPTADPGWNAVIVCLATAAVILAASPLVNGWAATRGLAKIGDFSYSLYLVHWPLFALARTAFIDAALPWPLTVALVAASYALAIVLYRWVETPLRAAPVNGWRLAGIALAASGAVAALGLGLGQIKAHGPDTRTPLLPVEGLAESGCFAQGAAVYTGACSESARPEMLVWGDSFSGHLTPGIAASTAHPLAQASMGQCAPFANYAAVVHANERAYFEGCLKFNASVLAWLAQHPEVRVVVLVGQYTRTLGKISSYALSAQGTGYRPEPLGQARTAQAQAETVAALHALGRRVIVVAPPPPANFDRGQCWARQVEHLPIWGRFASCRVDEGAVAPQRAATGALMAAFARAGAPVFDMRPALCGAAGCASTAGPAPLYRDQDHLSRQGAVVVGQRLQLGDRLWALAR